MIWPFLVMLVGYGLTALLFAFVEPPQFLAGLYRVPAIFVFLPDRWVMPAGRVFVGIASLATAGYVASRLLMA